MRLCFGHASCFGQTWLPIRFPSYRRFFGLRSLLAVSSVASGRIEFVSRALCRPQFCGLSVHFKLLSTSRCRDAVTFSCLAGSTAREGLSPSGARLLPSARARHSCRFTVKIQRDVRNSETLVFPC